MTCAQGLLRLLWGGARSWSATGLGVPNATKLKSYCRIYLNMGQAAISTSSDYLALLCAGQSFFYKSNSYIYKSINPAYSFTIYNPTYNNNTNNAYSITSMPRETRVTRVISTVIYRVRQNDLTHL